MAKVESNKTRPNTIRPRHAVQLLRHVEAFRGQIYATGSKVFVFVIVVSYGIKRGLVIVSCAHHDLQSNSLVSAAQLQVNKPRQSMEKNSSYLSMTYMNDAKGGIKGRRSTKRVNTYQINTAQ
jgi:hypothetical protein